MKLLITVQSIDTDEPLLGFFHSWVLELAKQFEEVHVICLWEGTHALPPNVYIHSLGKESGASRIKFIWRFYRNMWHYRNVDVVFSHMNPHYIVLGGWFWKLRGIRMFFWRNHARMNTMTRIAALFAERVFYTSTHACTSIFKHSVQMPVGIDTDVFMQRGENLRTERSVMFLGRLSKVKRPEIFMDAARLLEEYTVDVYGENPDKDEPYIQQLRDRAGRGVTFHGVVRNADTPEIYNVHEFYVNLTPEGSMDKTVLEAAACGTLTVVTNKSYQSLLPDDLFLSDVTATGLAERIKRISALPKEVKEGYRNQLRAMVVERHSLRKLMEKLCSYMLTPKSDIK
jgi:glycosyltransferase involved in cell wall biosynthesis